MPAKLPAMFWRLLFILVVISAVGIRVVDGQETVSVEKTGGLFRPLQFTIPIDPERYRNPFDPDDIELIGIFQSPSGQQFIIPGFWMQPYANVCVEACDGFDLRPEGDSLWRVRFTPQEVGDWSYTLQVRDNASIVAVEDGRFTIEPSNERGFIRLGANGRYFQYSNGQPYFPLGHNLNWSFDAAGGLAAYDSWLRELSDAGGNYARLFVDVPWFINLEWTGPVGDYRESQAAAAMLDLVLERAATYGVSLQLVLLWHQGFRTYNGPPVLIPDHVPRPNVSADWDDNPYNILNGGVLAGPSVFFFDETAEDLFRRRLRYLVARWGASPQIFSWEIIDRIDRISNFDPAVADPWLQSAINFLRQIDQYDHLITASSVEFTTIIASNPLLDFTSAQFYQRRPIESIGDQTTSVLDFINRYLQPNFAPVLLVDYSLSPWFEPVGEDPDGVHFQNTLWATALSGAAGGAMSDWWDTYIIPQNLSRYYAPLAAFTAGIDWPNLNLEPAQAGLLTGEHHEAYASVRIDNFRRQFAARPQAVVAHTITADGVFPSVDDVPSFLYGQVYNSQFSQAQRYHVVPPVDTYLEIGIEAVSTQADARLIVDIDGERAGEVSLRAGNRDIAIRVPLSAGEHTVVLDNLGDDWLELAYIEVGQLIAPARVLTLRDAEAGVVLAWLQHRDYTWEKVGEGVERSPLLFEFRLDGLPAGRYVAEIWGPLSGGVLGEEILRVGDDGLLTFDLLPMDRQLAIRAVRQLDPPVPLESPTIVPTDPPRQPPRQVTSAPSPLPTLAPFVANTNTPLPASTPRAAS